MNFSESRQNPSRDNQESRLATVESTVTKQTTPRYPGRWLNKVELQTSQTAFFFKQNKMFPLRPIHACIEMSCYT